MHTEQSELFVCIYIQELSIHVYKRVYILLRDRRFPMPCPRKHVCACFAAQKLMLQFLQFTPTKIALLTLAVPKTRGWARVGPTKTRWNNLGIKLCWVPLHDCVYMQAILLFTWFQNAYALWWCLGTLPQWSKGSLMRLCAAQLLETAVIVAKMLWKCCSTITLITCCNIATPIRLIHVLMQLRLTPIKTFIWR